MQPKKRLRLGIPLRWSSCRDNWHRWLPSRGNVLFTLLVAGLLLWTGNTEALPFRVPATTPSTSTIAYQGHLTNAAGAPITATTPMIFRLYSAASGGTPLWEEQWTGSNNVQVNDGLFNVLMGSLVSLPQNVFTNPGTLWLGITVGTDSEMAPRVQLGSVPYAMQALTVSDGSVTTAKLADNSVTLAKLGPDVNLVPSDGSITTAKLADRAVTQYDVVSGVSGATTNSTSFVDLPAQTITLTSSGGPVLTQFSGSFLNDTAGNVAYWRIIRDDAVVVAYNNTTFDTSAWNTVTIFGFDVPPAGTHTYKVQWRVTGGILTASAGTYMQNFLAIEFKR